MIHIIKLCVGVESLQDFENHIHHRCESRKKRGLPYDTLSHVTRAFPKRAEEISEGGSLYWIIKGAIVCRQPIIALNPVKEGGVTKCEIVLGLPLIHTYPQPRRAFQGWRYLKPEDAPQDMARSNACDAQDQDPKILEELHKLGLL